MDWVIKGIDSDEEVVFKKNSALLRNAAATYGKKFQRVLPPRRNEPSWEVSEFHLSNKRKKTEKLSKALAGSLDKTGKHAHISLKVKKVQNLSKPLPAPLERPEAEKIKRMVAFDNAKFLLNRWEPVVNANKVADQLNFPLNTPYFKMASTKNFLSNMKAKTPLEQEVENILSSGSLSNKGKDVSQKKTFFLNRKEIMEQRRELARIRAQQSYREAKARRQNKIKSKKYHRILRRENIKNQIQEFEKLQKSDPEAAIKKLEELEKTRAEERVTLRHRSTGQWARNKAVHAKYDRDCRQQLDQQLRLSRDLTQKVHLVDASDDEEVGDDEQYVKENNPWLGSTTNEYQEFSNRYSTFWDEQQLMKTKTQEVSNKANVDGFKGYEHRNFSVKLSDCIQSKKNRKSLNTSVMEIGFTVTDLKENQGTDIILGRSSVKNSNSFNSGWKCTEMKNFKLPNKQKKKCVAKSKKILIPKDLDDMFEDMEQYMKNKFEKRANFIKLKIKNQKTKQKKEANSKKRSVTKKCVPSLKGCEMSLACSINEETAGGQKVEKCGGMVNSNFPFQLIGKHETPSVVVSSHEKADNLDINPKSFIQINGIKLMRTQVPDFVANDGDNEAEIPGNSLMTISEAFADDDVVAEFRQDKEANIEKDSPKIIDLTLPGWGEWAGKGISTASKKRSHFILHVPKSLPRKDDRKETVIINEAADSKARVHQVNELPFPYVGVESFEANIRAPLGSTWIPETAHRNLIAPKVTTLLGAVIEPLSEDVLVDQSEVKKSFDGNDDILIAEKL